MTDEKPGVGVWKTAHDITDLGPANLSPVRPYFGQPIPMGKASEPAKDDGGTSGKE